MPKINVIYTVGHSTRPIGDFLAMLKAHDVTHLVDVRTIPRSRHNPQYEQKALSASLRGVHIAYTHMAALGGLRKPKADSINTGWRNGSFRGYADYMQTGSFAAALRELMGIAAVKRTAIMCAEAVPWRCHRSLIADALTHEGWEVIDIMDAAHAKAHTLNPMAKVRGGHLVYPADDTQQTFISF